MSRATIALPRPARIRRARNCRASWSSTALTMPVSSLSTKACATSTYSETTTRAGTSLRCRELERAGAQHRAQQRLDALERPAAAAAPRRSADRACAARRSTPRTTSRKNAASAGRYCAPSTSRPSQWLSNSARMSFKPRRRRYPSGRAPARRQAAPRRAGWPCAPRAAAARAIARPSRELALEPHQGQRGARRAAAFVRSVCARARQRLRVGVDGEDAVADRQSQRDRDVHQRARGLAARRCRSGWSRRGSRSRARPTPS